FAVATSMAKSTEYRAPSHSDGGGSAVSTQAPQRQRYFLRRCRVSTKRRATTSTSSRVSACPTHSSSAPPHTVQTLSASSRSCSFSIRGKVGCGRGPCPLGGVPSLGSRAVRGRFSDEGANKALFFFASSSSSAASRC